jgi:hypothetical protein
MTNPSNATTATKVLTKRVTSRSTKESTQERDPMSAESAVTSLRLKDTSGTT